MKARIASLHVYPVKGARGIDVERAAIAVEGLSTAGIGDREWLIVDEAGMFITQRSHPTLALVETAVAEGALRLAVPGHEPVDIALDARHGASRDVVVWHSNVRGYDEGDAIASALSAHLGAPLRLVRFDAGLPRLCNPDYTGDSGAHTRFADAFPLLVIGTASLDELNGRLGDKGEDALPMNRFRPNIVLEGLEPFDEDHVDTFSIGAVELRNVKPCLRCEVTTTDQATGVRGIEPLPTLASYRQNEVFGGVAFGVNAIITSGAGHELAVGQDVEATIAF